MCPLPKIDLACSNPQLKTLDGGVAHWEYKGGGVVKNTLYGGGGGGIKEKKRLGMGLYLKKHIGYWVLKK